MNRVHTLVAVLLVAFAGSVALLAAAPAADPPSGIESAEEPATPPFAIRDQRLRRFVRPSQQAELAAPLEEILQAVMVEESDRVKKGDVLAKMDDRLQEQAVEAARLRAASTAEMDRARLNLEEAGVDLERITAAFEKGAASDLELRRARIAVAQAETASVAAGENHLLAGVSLRLEEQRLLRYQVRAPFDGTVITVLKDAGSYLTDNERVLVLADLDTLEAHVHLPVDLFGQLEVGGMYTLRAEAPVNRDLEARLATINPIIDTASQTFKCVFVIENEGGVLPAGFTVYLVWTMESPRG